MIIEKTVKRGGLITKLFSCDKIKENEMVGCGRVGGGFL